jgi:transcriptional regulator with XRE-family HTH domain
MSDVELDSDEPGREFVIRVPLPSERLRPDSTLPKQHRYRALDVALAASIEPFRTEHDLTLAEVALAVGAANPSVVSQWEKGINVPSGVRKRRLIELLEGKRWELLREAVIDCEGMPQQWRQAVRWYRRASRGVLNRRTVGEVIVATLAETRALTTINELRQHYRERDSGWSANPATPMPAGATPRLAEDAAYGMRWMEIVREVRLDPRYSLVHAVPLKLIDTA